MNRKIKSYLKGLPFEKRISEHRLIMQMTEQYGEGYVLKLLEIDSDAYPDYETWCQGIERKGKILITSAETAEEALSDFIGYKEIEPTMAIDENSISKLCDVIGDVGNIELQNIVSLNSELPEDIDGWFAVRCAS